MQNALNHLASMIPVDLDLAAMGKFIVFLAAAMLVAGFIGKIFLGKDSDLNRSLCAAIGILFIYAITIVVYTFQPGDLARFLSPLPYVVFSGDKLYLFVFEGTKFSVICYQMLSMIILAFVYHLLDAFMPRGKGFYWLLYRFLTLIMGMALHYVAAWAINTFLPGALVTYATTAIVVVLLGLLMLGALKIVLGLVLVAVNPIIAAIYAFFFSNKIGKQLSKAVLTTLILTVLVLLLHHFGYSVISISTESLSAYLPLAAALLALWFIIGNIL